MTEQPKAHRADHDLPDPSGPAATNGQAVSALTQLHDLYARRAIERLVHGLSWQVYQDLANDVEERIARLLPAQEHARWVDQALLRECQIFHVEGEGVECELCRQRAA